MECSASWVENRNKITIAITPLSLDGGREEQTRRQFQMKKLLILPILAMTVVLAGPAQAGETTTSYKNVAQAPAPEFYGTGFYGAIHLGANIFQDRGDTRTFTNGFGDALRIDPNNDVGF